MIQNINLYPEYLKPKPVVLPFNQCLIITLVVFLLLIVVHFFLAWEKKVYSESLAKATTALDALESEMESFEEENPKREKSRLLITQEKIYSTRYEKQTKLLEYLSGNTFGFSEGYSQYLIGLARQHVEGLWLTDIYFKEGGSEVKLKGYTTQTQLITDYIKNLQQEMFFDHIVFTRFLINQSELSDRVLEFELSIDAPGDAQAAGDTHSVWLQQNG